MTISTLIFSFFAIASSGEAVEAPMLDQATVTFEITLCDGSSVKTQVAGSEVADFQPSDIGIDASEVFDCVSLVEGWGSLCTRSGSTCAEAVASSIQCIKAMKAIICV